MHQLDISQLDSLLSIQKQSIDYFFDSLDLQAIEQLVERSLKIKGLVILTGVGKSGTIAEKIAATLMSTGTRSLYLPAANLLHGDLGAISPTDLVILLSKSGQTQELIDIAPHLRKKGASTVAIVSEKQGRIIEVVDDVIYLPVLKELCPFDLAPTTSTAVQMLFGDLFAIELMHRRGFSLEQYAGNHPAGAIGRKVTLTVGDLMRTGAQLPLCKESDRLMEVIVELSNKRCGCLLTVDETMGLKGIFTDGDLRRSVQRHGAAVFEEPMGQLCSADPITLTADMTIHSALQKMRGSKLITAAPVTKSGQVIGLVRIHDLIHKELND